MKGNRLTPSDNELSLELVFEDRRTLSITVKPDLSVTVKAPPGTYETLIQERVFKRANWIAKKLSQYELYLPDVPPRQYVSGESHRFLGKQYRLKVYKSKDDEPENVHINAQFLLVHTRDKSAQNVKQLVETWYLDQAKLIFDQRLQACFSKFKRYEIEYPNIAIRKLKTSWGSCSSRGFITLNLKLIQVPKLLIDYVIIHELCHLVVHNHGPEFQRLLNRVMPD